MKEVIANQIRDLVPMEKFKPVHHNLYQGLTNVWADDIGKHVPKDHAIEEVEGELFIVKKEPQREGYDAFVANAQKIYTGEDEKKPFSRFLEDVINQTHWKQFLK